MKLLSIDPGETSAFVVGEVPGATPMPHPYLVIRNYGVWQGIPQLRTEGMLHLFATSNVIVVEDYRVYSSKANEHIGSRVYTAKEIGRIEWLASMYETPIAYQMASQAKGRWPNSRMKMYPQVHTFYKALRGHEHRKHILDAYRHLLTYVETAEGLGLERLGPDGL